MTPVTIPELPMVAIEVFEDDHVPPDAVLLKVIVLPAHTVAEPLIVPAIGKGFTVIN